MRLLSLLLYFAQVVVFLHRPASAYEVDNFTDSDIALEDSREQLNAEVERRLEKSIAEANSKMNGFFRSIRCDDSPAKDARVQLFKSLSSQFSSGYIIRGGMEDYAEQELTQGPRRYLQKIENQRSVYRGSESKILNNIELASVIQINGVRLGTDKLGHFFKEGFTYYDGRRQGTLELVRRTGSNMEKTFTGRGSTGVLSFADLAANYDGFRFWSRVLGEGISPCSSAGAAAGAKVYSMAKELAASQSSPGQISTSTKRDEPYICCQDGRFQRNPRVAFDFADYVSNAWDESSNCNRYSEELAGVVAENMKNVNLSKSRPQAMSCPRAGADSCKGLIRRYGGHAIAIHILHDGCICQDDPSYKACQPSSNHSAAPSSVNK